MLGQYDTNKGLSFYSNINFDMLLKEIRSLSKRLLHRTDIFKNY